MFPRSIGGCSDQGVNFGAKLESEGFSPEDIKFLSNHISSGTQKGYKCAFKLFTNFCTPLGINPFTCAPSSIVKFLRGKYEEGASYSTVNLYRSAISKFHRLIDGKPVGENSYVKQAVRAVFRLRAPLPRYKSTFDITPVLDYVASLEPLDSLSLKTLTLKTFFLLTFCTLSRVSSVARLGLEVETTKVQFPIMGFL